MYLVDRSLVVLKPTAAFLSWLKAADDTMPDIGLEQLQANCTTLLVPQAETPEETLTFVAERAHELFAAEVMSWSIDSTQIPEVTLQFFWEMFEAQVHDTVLDAVDEDLSNTPIIE